MNQYTIDVDAKGRYSNSRGKCMARMNEGVQKQSMIQVSNIERFATHDGPGIRTTIFLKGCTLHCPWCANPETWSIKPVLLHDASKCIQCRRCETICPNHAITFPFTWKQDLCSDCRKCEDICLAEAISFSGKKMEIADLVAEVCKDWDYYEQSHGGVTISGGEPFTQFEAFLALLKACKAAGLHVAVETTGNFTQEKLLQALPYIDCFLMDCKHLDADKLAAVTGGNLALIQANFAYLSKHCPDKVIVRMPVIPRFNEDCCKDVIDYAKSLHFKEVHLLPFHTMGKSKWHQMQKDFRYEKDAIMDKESLLPYVDYGKARGIHVQIGG